MARTASSKEEEIPVRRAVMVNIDPNRWRRRLRRPVVEMVDRGTTMLLMVDTRLMDILQLQR